MMRWLISVPVWGERFVDEFCSSALPPLDRAVAALQAARPDIDVRVVVHTDAPERVVGASGSPVDCRAVPAGARTFDCMSQAHREVLSLGVRGDVVVLLTAGAVVSEQSLVYCANVLDNPQLRLVLCAVPRVLQEGQIPDTASASELMRWAWDHRHPMTRECTWPDGRSADLSRTYFEGPLGVVTRQALPHPLAVRIDGRRMGFTPTVDANLIHCFDPIEMHVTADCNHLAVFKLSPADKGYELSDTIANRAASGALVIGNAHQRWCLSHRIVLCGAPDLECGDDAFLAAIRER